MCDDGVFCVLSVGRKSDRARKRRPVKIVSFDTDDTGTNSAPASNVVSPTVLAPNAHNIAVSAKTPMLSHELDEGAVDIVKMSGDLTASCRSHSEAADVGSLPGDVSEPHVSCAAHADVLADGLTLPKHCASKVESDFIIYRNSSLPNMGKDFGTDSRGGCSEDLTTVVSSRDVSDCAYSSSSTEKSVDAEGPQNLPSDNTWFDAVRDRASNVQSADAESIASNASTESSSSVNNHTRLVSHCLVHVHAGFVALKFKKLI